MGLHAQAGPGWPVATWGPSELWPRRAPRKAVGLHGRGLCHLPRIAEAKTWAAEEPAGGAAAAAMNRLWPFLTSELALRRTCLAMR